MSVYTSIVRPVLFGIHPDFVHEAVTYTGFLLGKTSLTRSLLTKTYTFDHPLLETDVFGLHFSNPIGIAGGFDKDCRLIQTLPAIGFGFSEVGSITAKPYKGNKRPWNTRLPKDGSLLVNYGLRNKGVNVLKKIIAKQHRTVPLIINIAKTNDPSIRGEESIADYNDSFVKLQPLADIVNINISCPNTGDGQLFCESPRLLDRLLMRLGSNTITKPIVLKIKPDLSDKLLKEIISVAVSYPFVKGFIISNLTNNRTLLKAVKPSDIAHISGGISGKPLRELSNTMIRKVFKLTGGKYPIIGLGGIFTAEDAYEKILSGASLVELATGLIYGGPGVIKKIKQGLVILLERDGYTSLHQAVGKRL